MTLPLLPVVPPLATDGNPRPFWSVMIPTYNPPAAYLAETLRSVLQQDPGPEQMQIEVVDDCSPKMDVAALVRKISGGRVLVSQTSKNLGIAGCWNTCIERARGDWVHILHQDDIVIHGFYERLKAGILASPAVGMAYTRFALIDGDGHWRALGPIEQLTPGILEGWLERVATGYHVECPAVAVRRSTYEQLGGFTPALTNALDVEMWVRIAARLSVYYEPKILACYRRHSANESSLRERAGENMLDMAKALHMWKAHLPVHSADRLHEAGSKYWAEIALMLAQKHFGENNLDASSGQLKAMEILWNDGPLRRARLKLLAKVKIHKMFGSRAIAGLRALRGRLD